MDILDSGSAGVTGIHGRGRIDPESVRVACVTPAASFLLSCKIVYYLI